MAEPTHCRTLFIARKGAINLITFFVGENAIGVLVDIDWMHHHVPGSDIPPAIRLTNVEH